MTIITFLVDLIRRLLPSFSNRPSHVATYTRELPISLKRMYENAIDGEHLPWLHSDSFADLTLIETGKWGWHGKGHLQPKSFMTYLELKLTLDREKNRWITKTLSGLGKGSEIWTHAIPLEENKIKVIVDFYVPKLPKFLHGLYATQFIETYAKLYDEDLWMMATRQNELDRLKAKKQLAAISDFIELGSLSEVEAKLPLDFEFNLQPYRLVKVDGELTVFNTTCPHMLGPLNTDNENPNKASCPWHGYEFDVKTGQCISGQKCQLLPKPEVCITGTDKMVSVVSTAQLAKTREAI